MKYLYCVAVPLAVQVLAVYIIVIMNTGNGSWLGLLAFLLAIPIIPITAIINAVLTKKNAQQAVLKTFFQSMIVAIAVPAVLVGLFVLATVMEGLVGRHF